MAVCEIFGQKHQPEFPNLHKKILLQIDNHHHTKTEIHWIYPHPRMPVTTRITTFLVVVDSYKFLFAMGTAATPKIHGLAKAKEFSFSKRDIFSGSSRYFSGV